MNDINERIRIIINERFRGVASTLARRLNAKNTTIHNYIKENPSKPNSDFLSELVIKLHIDAHWLLTGEGNMMQSSRYRQNQNSQDNNTNSTMFGSFNFEFPYGDDKKILGKDGISVTSSNHLNTIIAEKDTQIAEKDAQISKLLAMLDEKDKLIAKLIDKN